MTKIPDKAILDASFCLPLAGRTLMNPRNKINNIDDMLRISIVMLNNADSDMERIRALNIFITEKIRLIRLRHCTR